MENQLTNNANALRLFFTEDVFLVEDKSVKIPALVGLNADSIAVFAEGDAPVKTVSQPVIVAIPTVEPAEVAKSYPVEAENTPKLFKFLGGNKKLVLILVNDPSNDVSTEQGRELLRKIVKAVDLSTPDFAVLNYANYNGTDFVELHQFFKPTIMLSFGVEIADLKLNLTWQNEIILHGSTRIIFAPNLHQLDSDLTAKKMLWGNLQKIK